MNMLIKPHKFAQTMAIGPISEQHKSRSVDAKRDLPKPCEMAMVIKIGIAATAIFGLLALAALLWLWANPDWTSSIQRFQEMI